MITDWDKKKAELDGFEECVNYDYSLSGDADGITAMVTSNYIRFSKWALKIMKSPKFVKVFFDEKGKRMLVHKIDNTDGYAIGISSYKTPKAGQIHNCIKCRKPVHFMRNIIGIEGSRNASVEGKESEAMYEAVIFDLSKAKIMPRRVFGGNDKQ